MSKAFWIGFRHGYMKYFWVGMAFALGLALGSYSHPYEQCTRKGFTKPDDIGECIWLLQNQPSLR